MSRPLKPKHSALRLKRTGGSALSRWGLMTEREKAELMFCPHLFSVLSFSFLPALLPPSLPISSLSPYLLSLPLSPVPLTPILSLSLSPYLLLLSPYLVLPLPASRSLIPPPSLPLSLSPLLSPSLRCLQTGCQEERDVICAWLSVGLLCSALPAALCVCVCVCVCVWRGQTAGTVALLHSCTDERGQDGTGRGLQGGPGVVSDALRRVNGTFAQISGRGGAVWISQAHRGGYRSSSDSPLLGCSVNQPIGSLC